MEMNRRYRTQRGAEFRWSGSETTIRICFILEGPQRTNTETVKSTRSGCYTQHVGLLLEIKEKIDDDDASFYKYILFS